MLTELYQLEDLLHKTYANRANLAEIDELIAWLQLRRSLIETRAEPGKYYALPCPKCNGDGCGNCQGQGLV